MRKFFMTLSIVAFISSCTDERDVKPISEGKIVGTSIVYPERTMKTRGVMDTGFWENWQTVELASGQSVDVPWAKTTTTAIPYEIRNDIKAEDGWKLIAYTVKSNKDLGRNYMIFYNQFTGILKGFFYLEAGYYSGQTTGMWILRFEQPHSFLAFSDEMANTSDKKEIKEIRLTNITNASNKGFSIGWNCFQTELAYDPDFNFGFLQIIPTSITSAEFKINGDIDATTDGLVISSTTTNKSEKAIKGMANYVGSEAEKWVKNAVTNNKFPKIIKDLVINGAGDIVSSGLSSLLGSFTGGFNKNKETVQTVQLRTNANVELDGMLLKTDAGPIPPFTFSVSPEDVGRLGLWCLKENPCIKFFPYVTHLRQSGNTPYIQLYDLPVNTHCFIESERFEMNPDVKSQIKNYTVNATIYDSGKQMLSKAFAKEGNNYNFNKPIHGERLADNKYQILNGYEICVPLKDINGEILRDFEKDAPYEIFIPSAPDGTVGALPDFNCTSDYIASVEVTITTYNDKTFVSTHTFVPYFEWDYNAFYDGLYLDQYPCVPIVPPYRTIGIRDILKIDTTTNKIMYLKNNK